MEKKTLDQLGRCRADLSFFYGASETNYLLLGAGISLGGGDGYGGILIDIG